MRYTHDRSVDLIFFEINKIDSSYRMNSIPSEFNRTHWDIEKSGLKKKSGLLYFLKMTGERETRQRHHSVGLRNKCLKGSSKIPKEFSLSFFVNTFAYFMNNWGEINLSPFEPPNLLPPPPPLTPSPFLHQKYYSPHFLSSIDRASRNLKEKK